MPNYKLGTNSVDFATAGIFYSIPFNMENRDCIQFILDWRAGAPVNDASGSPVPYSDAAVIALGLTPPADPEE